METFLCARTVTATSWPWGNFILYFKAFNLLFSENAISRAQERKERLQQFLTRRHSQIDLQLGGVSATTDGKGVQVQYEYTKVSLTLFLFAWLAKLGDYRYPWRAIQFGRISGRHIGVQRFCQLITEWGTWYTNEWVLLQSTSFVSMRQNDICN